LLGVPRIEEKPSGVPLKRQSAEKRKHHHVCHRGSEDGIKETDDRRILGNVALLNRKQSDESELVAQLLKLPRRPRDSKTQLHLAFTTNLLGRDNFAATENAHMNVDVRTRVDVNQYSSHNPRGTGG